MEIENLLTVFGDYFAFVFNLLKFEGLDSLTRCGKLNSALVVYALIGHLVAYVIARIPSSQLVLAYQSESSDSKVEVIPQNTIYVAAAYFLFFVAVISFFHLLFIALNAVFYSSPVGNIFDSLNAGFAYYAAFAPTLAASYRLKKYRDMLDKKDTLCRKTAYYTLFAILVLLQAIQVVYGTYAYMVAHGIGVGRAALLVGGSALVATPAILIVTAIFVVAYSGNVKKPVPVKSPPPVDPGRQV
jgi:hypothetical protein